MQNSSPDLAISDSLQFKTQPRIIILGDGTEGLAYATRLAELGCRVTCIDLDREGIDHHQSCDLAVLAMGERSTNADLEALFDAVCKMTALVAHNVVGMSLAEAPLEYASFAPACPVEEERIAPWPLDQDDTTLAGNLC